MGTHWTPELADRLMAERGYVVCMGQFGADVRKHLEKQFRAGLIGKWIAPWNAPLGGKTIYGRLEFAEQSPRQVLA